MKDFLLLKTISALHILFVFFAVFTPFTKSNYFLVMHFLFIPFLIMHWLLNDNNCVITLVEKQIKSKVFGYNAFEKTDDCLTCKLIEPVYDFKKNNKDQSTFIMVITTCFWLLTCSKLYAMYANGEINKWKDLMRL